MNNTPYSEKNKFFYAVVALSVLSVIAASVGIYFTAKKIRSAGEEPTQTSVDWDNHPNTVSTTKANKREKGIKDERTTEPQSTETTVLTTQTTAPATQPDIVCSLPLTSNILKDYSNGTMVKSKTMNDWRTHNGVDFTGEQGDEVKAVCGGKVLKIETEPSWGVVVTVQHDNGLTARYCGLSETSVGEGDIISGGDVIGTLGVIPIESADTPHLHFEMLSDGKYTDPVEALSLQREED